MIRSQAKACCRGSTTSFINAARGFRIFMCGAWASLLHRGLCLKQASTFRSKATSNTIATHFILTTISISCRCTSAVLSAHALICARLRYSTRSACLCSRTHTHITNDTCRILSSWETPVTPLCKAACKIVSWSRPKSYLTNGPWASTRVASWRINWSGS